MKTLFLNMMEDYPSVKKNKIMNHTGKLMGLKIIIQGEETQSQKYKHRVLILFYGC